MSTYTCQFLCQQEFWSKSKDSKTFSALSNASKIVFLCRAQKHGNKSSFNHKTFSHLDALNTYNKKLQFLTIKYFEANTKYSKASKIIFNEINVIASKNKDFYT